VQTVRRSYVTREKAATLADLILESDAVTDVFLFGSLSQRKKKGRDPNDIDLLLFDRGEVSSFGSRYWRARVNPELLFESEFLDAPEHRAALPCGWLDSVAIDGTRFGRDADYTLSLCGSQRYRLFFLNIADALLKYDGHGRWVNRKPQVFERLVNLRRQLVTENIVPKHV
jgi:hypothetical protein